MSQCPAPLPSARLLWCVLSLLHFNYIIFNGSLRKFGFVDHRFVYTEIVALDGLSVDC